MTETPYDLATHRHLYAEELRIVAGLTNPALIRAFASVPRELYLGPPPWRIAPRKGLFDENYRLTDEPRDLYHDLVVALKSEKALNTAQPSIMAVLLEALHLSPGLRAVHIGSGSGYYSAILAEALAPAGSLLAIEADSDLYAASGPRLAEYETAEARLADGSSYEFGNFDRLLVNAAVTHLPARWLHGLLPDGRIVVPLYIGSSLDSRDALVLCIHRQGQDFTASLLLPCAFYPCSGLCDDNELKLLHQSLLSRRLLGLQRIRIDAHLPVDTCIAHLGSICLSA